MCGNGAIHEDNTVFDSILYQFNSSTFALIGSRNFAEGEGTNPQFTVDPVNRDYYYAEAGGGLSPQPLRRLRYADIAIYSPPAPIVLNDPAVGLINQLDSNPAITVPEPGVGAGLVLGAWLIGARARRGRGKRSSQAQSTSDEVK